MVFGFQIVVSGFFFSENAKNHNACEEIFKKKKSIEQNGICKKLNCFLIAEIKLFMKTVHS